MKKQRSRFSLKLLLIAALAVGVFFIARSRSAPSESEMLANFQRNKTALNQLVQMARADRIEYMSSRFDTTEASNKVISKYRFDDYQKLLQKIRLGHIILYHGNPDVYTFPVISGGMTDTSWAIGYAWSNKPLKNLVDSAYTAAPPRSIAYSKIEGNWFIYQR